MPLKFHKKFNWYKKRRSNSILLRREVAPLAIPIFIENLSVLLMGILSTSLVSWLGMVQMAAFGLAESFNMIIVSFFMAVALGTSVIVALSMGGEKKQHAINATTQSISLLFLMSISLVFLVELFGHQVIEIIAGQADQEVKRFTVQFLTLSALELSCIGGYFNRQCGFARCRQYKITDVHQHCDQPLQYFTQLHFGLRHF